MIAAFTLKVKVVLKRLDFELSWPIDADMVYLGSLGKIVYLVHLGFFDVMMS